MRWITVVLLLTISLIFFLAQPGWGAAPAKITILLLNRVSLRELTTEAGPFLRARINESACALITTNTAGTRSAGNTHATLGAGAPALSDLEGGLALNADETWMGVTAGLLYQQLTGDQNFPAGQVFLPRLPEAFRLNFSPVRTAVPCLLGQVLHENQLRTAVIGNADPAPPAEGISAYTPNRFAPWLAANHRGLVDYGDVGHRTLQPGAGPLPWETNYQYLLAKYQEFKEKADLLVLELGDFARLETMAPYLFDRQITAEKERLFSRLDRFFQTLWPLLDLEQEIVILLTPTPSLANLKQGSYLTPCFIWGKGYPAGFLSSPTTRHPGLVANVDFAPTIFHLFNLETPAHTWGRAMTAGHKGTLPGLLRFETKLNTIGRFRRQVLPVFLNAVAFCLPLTFLAVTLMRLPAMHPTRPLRTYLRLLVIFLSAQPAALHLASQLPCSTIPGFVGATLGLALVLTILSELLSRLSLGQTKTARLPSVPTTTSLFPLVSLAILTPIGASGKPALLPASVLGHDPMLGARFYGIGNELSGLFLGSLLGALLWYYSQNRTQPRRWAAVVFLAAVIMLSPPQLGANFGAGLTAMTITMALFLAHRPRKSFSARQLLVGLFILFLFALLLLAFDYLFAQPEQQSHFGLLLAGFKRRGFAALSEVVRRKLQVNLRLLGSRWTFLFLSAVLTFTGSFLAANRPFPADLFVVAFLGGGVGLLANDSGLVFAALFFYPLATTGLLLMLAKTGANIKNKK
ncbi:MAG TPA: hypothetical protein GXX33_03195 [Firmicutes bacterium]|nr:hypothetical protein [Bacillota bacterium]